MVRTTSRNPVRALANGPRLLCTGSGATTVVHRVMGTGSATQKRTTCTPLYVCRPCFPCYSRQHDSCRCRYWHRCAIAAAAVRVCVCVFVWLCVCVFV